MSVGKRIYGPTIEVQNVSGQRNIYVATTAPSNTDGQEGDIWIVYTA